MCICKLVLSEFNNLFPNRDITTGNCTVVTFIQKTENDMTAWNATMEAERDILTAQVCTSVLRYNEEGGFMIEFY